MKFIRGKENQLVNLEFVQLIDIVNTGDKLEVLANFPDFGVVLESFEHMDHAKAYLDNLWTTIVEN